MAVTTMDTIITRVGITIIIMVITITRAVVTTTIMAITTMAHVKMMFMTMGMATTTIITRGTIRTIIPVDTTMVTSFS